MASSTTEHLTGDRRDDAEASTTGDGFRSPLRETQPTAALLRRLIDELATLLTQEATLATAELSRAIEGMKSGIGSMASGGAVMFGGFLAVLMAAILALAMVMPGWLASLVVGIVVLIIGYAMLRTGRRRADPTRLKPKWTAESLRRDKEMLQNRRLQ